MNNALLFLYCVTNYATQYQRVAMVAYYTLDCRIFGFLLLSGTLQEHILETGSVSTLMRKLSPVT